MLGGIEKSQRVIMMNNEKFFYHDMVPMKSLIVLLSFFFYFTAVAGAVAEDALKISGFGTIALTSSNSDVLGFRRNFDSGSLLYGDSPSLKQDSSLGLQLDYSATSNLRGVLQLLAKDRVDNSPEDFVNYAFIEYSPFAWVSARAGRVPLDIFLLADYRDVGFAYSWVRPVSSIYRTLFYDHYDGAEIRFSHQFGRGLAEVRLNAGALDALLPLDTIGEVRYSFKPLLGINLRYYWGAWKFIGGVQRLVIDGVSDQLSAPSSLFAGMSDEEFPFSSLLAREVSLVDSHSTYFSAGIAYEEEPWFILGEIAKYDFERALGLNYTCGYLSVGYQVGHWTPFVVLSAFRGDLDTPIEGFEKYENSVRAKMGMAAVRALVHDTYSDEGTVSLGVRWDVWENVSLKTQWDYCQVLGGHGALWRRKELETSDRDESVSIFTLALSFIF